MRSVLSLLLVLACTTAAAKDFTLGPITIDHPWARPTPPGVVTGAGYVTIKNSENEPDRLTSASSRVSERVEFHTHLMDGDVMRMREMEAVDLPAAGSVEFAPGGMHLMLIGLESPLVEGNAFPLTLTFERSGQITVTVTVEHPGE